MKLIKGYEKKRRELIQLAKREIKEWTKFLKELKKTN